MIVYRIHKKEYDPLDGTGAAMFGRRWNKRGAPVVYASSSLALARAEIGAKAGTGELSKDYIVSEIEIDGDFNPQIIQVDELGKDWKNVPFPKKYQEYGNKLLKQHPIFQVPSVKDPLSNNVVTDPNHPEVKKRVHVIKQYPLK